MAVLRGLVHGIAEVDGHPSVEVDVRERHPGSTRRRVGCAADPTPEGLGLRFDPSRTASVSWRTICGMQHIHLVEDILKNNVEGVVG